MLDGCQVDQSHISSICFIQLYAPIKPNRLPISPTSSATHAHSYNTYTTTQYVTGCRRLIQQLGLEENVTLHGLGNPQKVCGCVGVWMRGSDEGLLRKLSHIDTYADYKSPLNHHKTELYLLHAITSTSLPTPLCPCTPLYH